MGIDYGRGKTNIDTRTGIRYGIFPVRMFDEWFWEGVESVYGFNCPHCGNDLEDNGNERRRCSSCGKKFTRDDGWSQEPILNGLSDYKNDKGLFSAWVDDSNDVWFTDSKWVYPARFASPCAPGAGYLGKLLAEDEGDCLAYGPNPDELGDEYKGRIVVQADRLGNGLLFVSLAPTTGKDGGTIDTDSQSPG